jgi:hypothetical protein
MADFYNGFEYLSIFLNGNDAAIHCYRLRKTNSSLGLRIRVLCYSKASKNLR